MESVESEILNLFNRYLAWIQDNDLEDNTYNYAFFLEHIYD